MTRFKFKKKSWDLRVKLRHVAAYVIARGSSLIILLLLYMHIYIYIYINNEDDDDDDDDVCVCM